MPDVLRREPRRVGVERGPVALHSTTSRCARRIRGPSPAGLSLGLGHESLGSSADVGALRGRVTRLARDFPLCEGLENSADCHHTGRVMVQIKKHQQQEIDTMNGILASL